MKTKKASCRAKRCQWAVDHADWGTPEWAEAWMSSEVCELPEGHDEEHVWTEVEEGRLVA